MNLQIPHSQLPEDVHKALWHLSTLSAGLPDDFINLAEPMVIGRAPGRLDVMGGIADYSGSQVLQMPIREGTVVCLQRRSDKCVSVVSVSDERKLSDSAFTIALEQLDPNRHGESLESTASSLSKLEGASWAAYIVGVFTVLMDYTDAVFDQGVNLFVYSTVPEGKGVSSSAALEVATMIAVAKAFHLRLEMAEIAVLCQKVENNIVGAPCGIMDQMTSACGEQDKLLSLLCQPATLHGSISLPAGIRVWGVDSGVRHAVTGNDYNAVRTAAFMGYRIILDLAGIAARDVCASTIKDHRWGGYLANVPVSEFETHYKHALPDTMSGETFLEQYDNHTDTITAIDPAGIYPVSHATAHPVHENERVKRFADLLKQLENNDNEATRQQLGQYMNQSHASYSCCGLGSEATDQIHSLVQEAGADSGLYGARITGGGSGGTVAVLADYAAFELVDAIARQYRELSGLGGKVFSGSSNGAMAVALLQYG